ncbi:MAG: tetratricopeptide repeat protein [Spirochaetota bacterium]
MKRFFIVAYIVTGAVMAGPLSARADSFFSLVQKGNRSYKSEAYSRALDYYKKAADKRPGDPLVTFNSADALYKMEDYVKAIDMYNRALENTEDQKQKSQIYYNIGNSYFRLREYHKSVEYFKKALEHHPYNMDIKHNLELALQKLSSQAKTENKTMDQSRTGAGNEAGSKPSENRSGKNGENTRPQNTAKNKTDQRLPDKPQPDTSQNYAPGMDSTRKSKQQPSASPTGSFSAEEARRLFGSVADQHSETMNEIIKKRLTRVENEKDW